jgi:uncharacterized membrane protein
MTSTELTKRIAENGMVAAIYFVVTFLGTPIAFGQIQFRIAEILVLLCFFRPDFVIGVTLGCLLANLESPMLPWDLIFGVLATLLSSLLVAYASPRMLVAIIYPVIFNGFIVGAELYWILDLPFWLNVGFVSLGEATVLIAGYILFFFLRKNKGFMNALGPTRHATVTW